MIIFNCNNHKTQVEKLENKKKPASEPQVFILIASLPNNQTNDNVFSSLHNRLKQARNVQVKT